MRDTYVLRSDDVVELSVYQEPDLDKTATILKTGEAWFPLVDAVHIEGLTLVQASEEIRKRYAAEYIRYPRVSLTVTEYAVDYVSVIGRVVTPVKIPLTKVGGLDLRSALATAGGPTELADREKIEIKSADGASRVLTYEAILKSGDQMILKADDQVVVNDSPFAGKMVSVVGEVNNPDSVAIPSDGNLDIATALAKANGLTKLADENAIGLVRAKGGTLTFTLKEIQRGKASKLKLQGGDRIVVPKSRYVNATVSITGQVKNAGLVSFPLDGRLDLLKAIATAGGITDLANPSKVILSRPGADPLSYNLAKVRAGVYGTVWLSPDDEIKVSESLW